MSDKQDNPASRNMLSAGSTAIAIITLAKGTLGAGILDLSLKTQYSGIPLFLVLLSIGAYFTARSIQYIARGAQKTGKYVFEEITEALLGKYMAIMLGVSMLLNCYGASVVYAIVIYDSLYSLLKQVVDTTGVNWPLYSTLIVGGLVLVPLSIFEKINSLRALTVAGVLGVFFTVLSVVYALGYNGVSPSFDSSMGGSVGVMFTPQGGFVEIMSVISSVTFAFCNQFNVPQVYDEMKDKSERAVSKVAYVSTTLAMVLYVIVAITGYLCYGMELDKDLMLNLEPFVQAGNVLIYIGISAVTLSVAVSHLLNNFPMRLSVIFFLPAHMHDNKMIKLAVPLFTAISTIAIACVYPHLSVFLGLVGSLTGSVICYIVPALFSIRIHQLEQPVEVRKEKGYVEAGGLKSMWSLASLISNPVESLMVLLGIVIAVVGTFCEIYRCV